MKSILIIDDNLPYLLNGINFPVGGATVQTKSWLHGFEKLGFNIVVSSSIKIKNSSAYTIEEEKESISKNRVMSMLIKMTGYYKLLRKYNPVFIYISIPWWSNFLFFIPAKILKIKIVQRISNDNLVNEETINRFDKKYKFILYNLSLRLTDVFLCQNDYQQNKLKKRYTNKVIDKLYNPFFIANKKKSNKRNYVAWIGLFQHQKNLPSLVKIVEILPEVKFKLAGKSQQIIDSETQTAINKLKKMPNVEFVGLIPRDKIYDFLSNAYCLLNTSHIEGFSNTYLEAFSVGTKVVTRKKTDPDGIISKFDLGKSVAEYSELPGAIEEIILSDYDSKHIKKYLLENHDPYVLAQRLMKIIKIK